MDGLHLDERPGRFDCTVTMNAAKTATATFTSVALRVNITGAGSVTSDIPGVDCLQSCTGQFEPTAAVKLTATAASTSAFTSWTGCASV